MRARAWRHGNAGPRTRQTRQTEPGTRSGPTRRNPVARLAQFKTVYSYSFARLSSTDLLVLGSGAGKRHPDLPRHGRTLRPLKPAANAVDGGKTRHPIERPPHGTSPLAEAANSRGAFARLGDPPKVRRGAELRLPGKRHRAIPHGPPLQVRHWPQSPDRTVERSNRPPSAPPCNPHQLPAHGAGIRAEPDRDEAAQSRRHARAHEPRQPRLAAVLRQRRRNHRGRRPVGRRSGTVPGFRLSPRRRHASLAGHRSWAAGGLPMPGGHQPRVGAPWIRLGLWCGDRHAVRHPGSSRVHPGGPERGPQDLHHLAPERALRRRRDIRPWVVLWRVEWPGSRVVPPPLPVTVGQPGPPSTSRARRSPVAAGIACSGKPQTEDLRNSSGSGSTRPEVSHGAASARSICPATAGDASPLRGHLVHHQRRSLPRRDSAARWARTLGRRRNLPWCAPHSCCLPRWL